MYRIRLLASAHNERRNLPGVIRQRIKNIIEALGEDARPDNSILLRFYANANWEPRRIRVDLWRIIYAVDDEFQQIVVLAIKKGPPYDYEDVLDLLAELE